MGEIFSLGMDSISVGQDCRVRHSPRLEEQYVPGGRGKWVLPFGLTQCPLPSSGPLHL